MYHPNVPFYEHFGFKVAEVVNHVDGEDSLKVLHCL